MQGEKNSLHFKINKTILYFECNPEVETETVNEKTGVDLYCKSCMMVDYHARLWKRLEVKSALSTRTLSVSTNCIATFLAKKSS